MAQLEDVTDDRPAPRPAGRRGNALLTGKLLAGAGMPQLAGRDTILTRIKEGGAVATGVTRDGARFLGFARLDNDLKLVVSPNWIVEFREKIAARKR